MANEAAEELRRTLRELRQVVGSPSLTELETAADLSGAGLARSTASDALNSAKPLPSKRTVRRFVDACRQHAGSRRSASGSAVNLERFDAARLEALHDEASGSQNPLVPSSGADERDQLRRASVVRKMAWPPRPERAWLVRQPSRVLHMASDTLDFLGRREEMERFATWRDSVPARSVLLMHAQGGQGKSRLALQFARETDRLGWSVLEGLQRDDAVSGEQAGRSAPAPARERGVLLVVDYADRWTHRELFDVIGTVACRQVPSVRVLLIARSVKWWPAMQGELDAIGVEHEDMPLAELAAGDVDVDVETVFGHAVERYADVLGVADPASVEKPGRQLSETEGVALNILSLALVAVDAHQRGRSLPTRRQDLAGYLLGREHRNWVRLHNAGLDGRDFRTPPSLLARVVFVAALCGELPYGAATTALGALGLEGTLGLLDDHRVCYPPSDRGKTLGPLYPDRLAEDFIALTLPGHDVSGYDPDPWASTAPDVLFPVLRKAGATLALRRMVTFLAASSERWPHVAALLSTFIDGAPDAAVEAGSEAIASIARNADIAIAAIDRVDSAFPPSAGYDLATGRAAIMERRARHYLPEADARGRAELNYGLGTRLHAAGRSREAIGPITEAAAGYEAALPDGAEDAEEMYASALTNRATVLTHLGELETALEVEQVALAVRRRLAEGDEKRHGADFADSLTNLAVDLWYLGRVEEALDVSAESVAFRRRTVAHGGEEDDREELARSLSNHGMVLNTTGRKDESLEALLEAVGIYRDLVDSRPDVHTPHFAMALGNLAASAGDIGLLDDAIAYGTEAIETLRRLSEVNPGLYLRELATAIDNVGQHALKSGDTRRAVKLLEEACDIREGLALESPAAYEAQLADSLENLGQARLAMAEHEPAMAHWTRSLSLRRREFSRFPERGRTALVGLLIEASRLREELGDVVGAAALQGEAEETRGS